MNDTSKMPYIKVTCFPDNKAHVLIESMTTLQLLYTSLLLMTKVYDNLIANDHHEMAELVDGLLEPMEELYQLASQNSKSSKSN